MKALPFLALAALASSSFAGVPISREEASSLRTFTTGDLRGEPGFYDGQLLRLKFSRRNDIDKAVNGLHESSVSSEERKGIGGAIYVLVPTEGLGWFQKISDGLSAKGNPYVVVARIEEIKGSKYVRFLGRQIKTTSKGSEIVW